ncbi:MAG: Smr/MutS family endonuclease [Xanthomonadales bacterium]|jgi:DNA-nicking Smr family endonuclease|nr:Smr/MutS family endonuclease [Xanthomonadales bacterium]
MNDDDRKLFREAVGDVRPVRNDRIRSHAKPVPLEPTQRALDEAAVVKELLSHPYDPNEWSTGEELHWLRSGYQRRILTRLKRGHYAVRDELDLHHMNEETAAKAIHYFIEESLLEGHSCVRIIHGKGLRSRGLPILKLLTARLLPRLSPVVGFCSARLIDGGSGAVYVLLRQPRKGN